jgi:Icc protein
MLGTAPLLSLPAFATAIPSGKTLKIAYLTDIHLPASNEIDDRLLQAFKKAQKADIFLFGGDNVMAVDNQPEHHIRAQFDNWRRLTEKHVTKPHRSIIGNHDMEMGPVNDGTYYCGKRRTMELYGMQDRYWTEKVGGWRIIGLDTVQKGRKGGYSGHVDKDQRKWLEEVLMSDRTTPTMIMGHIPLLSVTALADRNIQSRMDSVPVSFCSQVGNARDIIKIIRDAGNVKLCMSGHAHMNDKCEFAGTTYICAGSVSGGWWKGAHQGFGPSCTEIDLMANGHFDTKTVHFE